MCSKGLLNLLDLLGEQDEYVDIFAKIRIHILQSSSSLCIFWVQLSSPIQTLQNPQSVGIDNIEILLSVHHSQDQNLYVIFSVYL